MWSGLSPAYALERNGLQVTNTTDGTRRAWVEVDPAALRRNGRRLAERVGPGVGLLPMVKADGYGLGVATAVDALSPLDPWGFGVATAAEAAELGELGWEGRTVVFSPCAPLDAGDVVRLGAEPAISSLDALRAFGEAAASAGDGRSLPVHLEVDTGMGRAGLAAGERDGWIPELVRALADRPVELASTFTHFHSAESDEEATVAQAEALEATLADLRAAGVEPGLVHLSNSAAVLRHPDLSADVVRPGLFLYGGAGGEPVAAVRARVLDVRDVPAGRTVSYGALYRTPAPARIATLGVGYGDGLRRELSERGSALVAGRRAPIRGAVCMDVTVVDVTDVPGVRPGTVATVLGRDGGGEIPLEEMAGTCGTIPYEILTGLGRRLPRLRRDEVEDADRGDDVA